MNDNNEQVNTAAEQLQARIKKTSESTKTQTKVPLGDDDGDGYSECYPKAFDLKSFRASEESNQQTESSSSKHGHHHKQQGHSMKDTDRKIARDLNKLEQWKRNAQERESKLSSSDGLPSKRPRSD